MLLSIVFDTLECTAYLVHQSLEHFASGLLVEPVPSCNDVHLRYESQYRVDIEIVECGESVNLLPHEVVNASFTCENVILAQYGLKVGSLFEFLLVQRNCDDILFSRSPECLVEIFYLGIAYVEVKSEELPYE